MTILFLFALGISSPCCHPVPLHSFHGVLGQTTPLHPPATGRVWCTLLDRHGGALALLTPLSQHVFRHPIPLLVLPIWMGVSKCC